MKRSLIGKFTVFSALLLLVISCPHVFAQNAAVVRLSYVQGTVQILQNGTVHFPKAVVNMPLFSGYAIATQEDGEAEIEFADGSVARLTPNSSLQLTHLDPAGDAAHTALELNGGLGYFELNVGAGQNFSVKVGSGTIVPTASSIFRAALDNQPEVAVFQGAIHLVAGPDSGDIHQGETAHFGTGTPPSDVVAQSINPDSWDQWNVDRDSAISSEAQSQTAAREDTAAPGDPGWNDLDANGNWYPVEDYGNVWVPNGVDAGWDPFGYGYWSSYPAYGAVWVSGYPWGWLPYHCGAWNYFQFGWGWVPGGCGLGWSPTVAIWNAPPRYRLPPLPPHPYPMGGARTGRLPVLTLVDRGSAARGPWGPGTNASDAQPVLGHSATLQNGGTTLQPLRRGPVSNMIRVRIGDGNRLGSRVGVPVAHLPVNSAPVGARVPSQQNEGAGSGLTPRAPVVARPTYTPPPAPHYEAPHYSAPPPPPAAAPSRPH